MMGRWFVMLLAIGLTGCDQQMDSATDAVAYSLKDPDSAKFRNVRRCGPKGEVYSGEVNSKNSYGAYGGFEHFYSDGVLSSVGFADRRVAELQERCFAEGDGKTADEARKIAAGAQERLEKKIDADMSAMEANVKSVVDKAAAEQMAEEAAGVEAWEKTEAKHRAEQAEEARLAQCRHGYCPCEESDDYAATMCERLEAGLPVDRDMAELGKTLRGK
jgi:ribosomal protein S1